MSEIDKGDKEWIYRLFICTPHLPTTHPNPLTIIKQYSQQWYIFGLYPSPLMRIFGCLAVVSLCFSWMLLSYSPVQEGKSKADACNNDDDDDRVDVQKIVQHCHFKSRLQNMIMSVIVLTVIKNNFLQNYHLWMFWRRWWKPCGIVWDRASVESLHKKQNHLQSCAVYVHLHYILYLEGDSTGKNHLNKLSNQNAIFRCDWLHLLKLIPSIKPLV